VEVLQFLIDHKANLNVQDNEGWTPVHAAVWWNQVQLIVDCSYIYCCVRALIIYDSEIQKLNATSVITFVPLSC